MYKKMWLKRLLFVVVVTVFVSTPTEGAAKLPKTRKELEKQLDNLLKNQIKKQNDRSKCVPTTSSGIFLNCYYKTDEIKTQYCCAIRFPIKIETCRIVTGFENGKWCDCGAIPCSPTNATTPVPPCDATTESEEIATTEESAEMVTDSPTEASPAETTTMKTKPPGGSLKCYSCEVTQGDTSLACKDKPKTTKVVHCKPGEVCRTLSFISEARGGSVIIRGCADPNDLTPIKLAPRKKGKGQHKQSHRHRTTQKPRRKSTKRSKGQKSRLPKGCEANPPFLPSSCDRDNEDCDHVSCACTCVKDFCNKAVGLGDGWDLCLA